MKKMLLIMLITAGAFYVLLTTYFTDTQINKYDSITAVHENKAIKEGWIPKILPTSAYDIVETHDIDTNQNFGKFKYKEQDEADFLTQLSEDNDTYSNENFLFKINKEKNEVKFRNKVNLAQ